MVEPFDIKMDVTNQRLVITDIDKIQTIDISGDNNTGNISTLSNSDNDIRNALKYFTQIAIDDVNNRAFVVNTDNGVSNSTLGENLLIEIDFNTGNRTEVATLSQFGRPTFIGSFVYDKVNNRIVYIDLLNDELIGIDIDSFEFTVLASDIGLDFGGIFNVQSFALDTLNNRALAINIETNVLTSINLDSGESAIISSSNVGSGPAFLSPYGISIDEQNKRAFVVDDESAQIFTVDLDTGNRSILSDSSASVPLRLTSNPVLDIENNRLFLIDFVEDSIYIIDIPTGERAIVAH